MLDLLFRGEFLLHIPYWLLFSFLFIWGVSLTPPLLASFLSGEFLLNIPCWLHFYMGRSGEFLLHMLCCFHFYAGSFSYTSRAVLIFIGKEFLLHIPCWFIFIVGGHSLTHPVLASFLSEQFFLHIPSLISYTARDGFIFMCGVSLTHDDDDCFYIALFSALEQTHCARLLTSD